MSESSIPPDRRRSSGRYSNQPDKPAGSKPPFRKRDDRPTGDARRPAEEPRRFRNREDQPAENSERPPRAGGRPQFGAGNAQASRNQTGSYRNRDQQSAGPAGSFRKHAAPPPEQRRRRYREERKREVVVELGEEIELQIESMTLEGQTVAWFNGFVVFVSGAIPGERVLASVVTTGADFARAEVTRVLQRSPHRARPECRHFGVCGGCQWQHLAYSEQLGWKEELLRSTIQRQLPKAELLIRPILGNPSAWGTRNKVYYRVAEFRRANQRKLLLCHPRGHSIELEPIKECPVHHPEADQLARQVLLWLRERGVREAKPHEPEPGLLGILVRRAGETNQSHIVLVATSAELARIDGLSESLLKLPGVTGVHLNIQPDATNPYLGPETRLLAGDERLVDEVAGVRFHVSPVSFFQTNAVAARHLVETVLRYVPPEECDPVLDLYCGVGLFSIPLAKAGHTVTAVEESASAVADGIETLKQSGISGCHFINDRVQNVLRRMPKDRRYRTVILDPPRDGCPDWAVKVIGRGQRPDRIIHVSCNADALARDLFLLTRSGYAISEIQPIDMFPHTSHIEAVTLLQRKHRAGEAGNEPRAEADDLQRR